MTGVWVDRFGTLAASACAVHCGILSLAPAVLSVVGLGALQDERFEWGFVACAVAFAAVAALLGHRKHRSWAISLSFALGAFALVGARVLEEVGTPGGVWVAMLGGAVLVGAHIYNTLQCRACATECTEASCSTG